MYLGSSSSGPQSARSEMGRRASIHRRLVCIFVLALGGLAAAGVVIAGTNPDWPNDWSGTEPMSISGDLPLHSWQPVIASDPSSGLMVVAWSNPPSESAPRNIYTVHSTDNGRTWSDPAVISETAADSLLPDALVVGNQIFVAWIDSDPPDPPTAIYVAEGSIGETWDVYTIPSSLPMNAFTRPQLAASAGNLHAVFAAGDPDDILYTARPLTATVWPTATVIYTHTSDARMRYPVLSIGTDDQALHIVWEEYTTIATRTVSYMRGEMSANSINWLSATLLSEGIPRSVWPTIAAGPGEELHVAWGEQIGAGFIADEQYIRYIHYNGSVWSNPKQVDSDPVDINHNNPAHLAPSIALLESGNQATVCVAWHGFRKAAGAATAEEVLTSCSYRGELSWPSPQNVSRSPGYTTTISILPSIAFDTAGQLHVVWQELAGASLVDDYQIYHSRALDQIFLAIIMRNG